MKKIGKEELLLLTLFLLEVFPLKSSGSFFTTGNSTIIFLVMAIIVGLVEKKDKI